MKMCNPSVCNSSREALKSISIAVITIMLCIGIVTASTYAIFTNNTVIENHLVAGNLNVTLERTALYRTVLNEKGVLVTLDPDTTLVNFSGSNKSNILGFGTNDTIVPGVDCKADLRVTNIGNIAVDYTIRVVTRGDEKGEINELAKQMVFYVTRGNDTVEMTLEQLGQTGYAISTSRLLSGDSSTEFTVGVRFVDYDAGENPDAVLGTTNNKAQGQQIYFDIIIEAIQSTENV